VLLYLVGRATPPGGRVVEYGTWAGSSSRCIAHGLADAARVRQQLAHHDVLHNAKKLSGAALSREAAGALAAAGAGNPATLEAFDKFGRTEWHKMPARWAGAADLLAVWKQLVLPVYPQATPHGGKIDQHHGYTAISMGRAGLGPVDVFIMDCAKHLKQFREQMLHLLPHLRVGGLIVFADFNIFEQFYQVAFVYATFVVGDILREGEDNHGGAAGRLRPEQVGGALELVHVAPDSSHWTFAVTKPLAPFAAAIKKWWGDKRLARWPAQVWQGVYFDRALKDLARAQHRQEAEFERYDAGNSRKNRLEIQQTLAMEGASKASIMAVNWKRFRFKEG